MRLPILLISALLWSGAIHSQDIIFVDGSNTSSPQDGTSWETAFSDLQDAFEEVSHWDSIFVKGGVYHPRLYIGGATWNYRSFRPRGRVYGGFDGTEATLKERDNDSASIHGTNATILSGNVGWTNNVNDNSYHVLTAYYALLNMNDLTIAEGYATGQDSSSGYPGPLDTLYFHHFDGGAFTGINSNVTFKNVIFKDNHASRGGGAFSFQRGKDSLVGEVTFIDCQFIGNTVDWNDPQDKHSGGGAIKMKGGDLDIHRCRFENNSVAQTQGGGAIRLSKGVTGQISNCTFNRNSVVEYGGGGAIFLAESSDVEMNDTQFEGNIAAEDGGALYNWKSNPVFIQCVFLNNSAGNDGGGIFNYFESSPQIDQNIFIGNVTEQNGGAIYNTGGCHPICANTLIHNNSAGNRGGGIYSQMSDSLPCDPLIVNSTITMNIADSSGGGVYDDGYGESRIWNTIVSNNLSPVGTDIDSPAPMNLTAFLHSIIGSEYFESGTSSISWSGSLFLNSAQEDYRLAPNSVALDLGDSTIFDSGTTPNLSNYTRDLNGQPRTMGTSTDLGAFETCADTSTAYTLLMVAPSDTVEALAFVTFTTSMSNIGTPDSFAWLFNDSILHHNDPETLVLRAGLDIVSGDEILFWYDGSEICVDSDTGRSNKVRITVVDPLSINDPRNPSVELYPNPVGDILSVSSTQAFNCISLYNPMGQLVHQEKQPDLEFGRQISIAQLPPGWYGVVISGDHSLIATKVIKY